MDINGIVTLVSNIGFPILCVVVMFKVYREDLSKIQEAITNNTIVIQKLVDKLEKLK